MRVADQDHFLTAMDKELKNHISHEHWAVIAMEEAVGHGLGNVPEAMNQHKGSLQMESQAKHPWWTTGSCGEQLGDLCTSGVMANTQVFLYPINVAKMEA